jgi:hypothetical protein
MPPLALFGARGGFSFFQMSDLPDAGFHDTRQKILCPFCTSFFPFGRVFPRGPPNFPEFYVPWTALYDLFHALSCPFVARLCPFCCTVMTLCFTPRPLKGTFSAIAPRLPLAPRFGKDAARAIKFGFDSFARIERLPQSGSLNCTYFFFFHGRLKRCSFSKKGLKALFLIKNGFISPDKYRPESGILEPFPKAPESQAFLVALPA